MSSKGKKCLRITGQKSGQLPWKKTKDQRSKSMSHGDQEMFTARFTSRIMQTRFYILPCTLQEVEFQMFLYTMISLNIFGHLLLRATIKKRIKECNKHP